MADFGSADAEQDAQNFYVGGSLRQLRIEAAAALLDPGEVESGGVGDGLQERAVGDIAVGARNGGVASDGERGNGMAELVAEVGIAGPAAVARPPIGVDGELGQVGEATEGLVRSCGLAGRQGAERVEVDCVCAL